MVVSMGAGNKKNHWLGKEPVLIMLSKKLSIFSNLGKYLAYMLVYLPVLLL